MEFFRVTDKRRVFRDPALKVHLKKSEIFGYFQPKSEFEPKFRNFQGHVVT